MSFLNLLMKINVIYFWLGIITFFTPVYTWAARAIIYVDHPAPTTPGMTTFADVQTAVAKLNEKTSGGFDLYSANSVDVANQMASDFARNGTYNSYYFMGEGKFINENGYLRFDGLIQNNDGTYTNPAMISPIFSYSFYCGSEGYDLTLTVAYAMAKIAQMEGLSTTYWQSSDAFQDPNDPAMSFLVSEALGESVRDLITNYNYNWALGQGVDEITAAQWALGLISREKMEEILRKIRGDFLN